MTPATVTSLVATVLLIAVSAANATEQPKDVDSASRVKLWALLDSMDQKMPLTKASFENALGVSTFEKPSQDGNGVVLRGEPFELSNDLGVSGLNLWLDRSGRFQYAGLTVHGICIRYKEVKEKYGPLIIVDTPKGHTPFDDTLVQSKQPWGSYYFVFLDIAADCLHKVTVSPRKEEGI